MNGSDFTVRDHRKTCTLAHELDMGVKSSFSLEAWWQDRSNSTVWSPGKHFENHEPASHTSHHLGRWYQRTTSKWAFGFWLLVIPMVWHVFLFKTVRWWLSFSHTWTEGRRNGRATGEREREEDEAWRRRGRGWVARGGVMVDRRSWAKTSHELHGGELRGKPRGGRREPLSLGLIGPLGPIRYLFFFFFEKGMNFPFYPSFKGVKTPICPSFEWVFTEITWKNEYPGTINCEALKQACMFITLEEDEAYLLAYQP